jgi:hypothetical protein
MTSIGNECASAISEREPNNETDRESNFEARRHAAVTPLHEIGFRRPGGNGCSTSRPYRNPRQPLPPVPACKFFGRRHRSGRLEIEFRGAAKLDAVGHEPAPVARACSPAYLLGSPKLTWLPGRIDAWACAPCSSHIHGTHASTAIIVAVVIKLDDLVCRRSELGYLA